MLRNRHLSVCTLSFAAGIAAGFYAYTAGMAVSILLCALFGAAVCVCSVLWAVKRTVFLRNALLVTVGLLCGVLRLLAVIPLDDARYAPFAGRADTVECVVVESGADEGSTELLLRVERSHTAIPKGTLLLLYADTDLPVRNGNRITAEVTDLRLPGTWQRARGASLACDGRVLSVRRGSEVLETMREACRTLYNPYGEEGTVQALLLRERSMLKESTVASYRNAGLAHLLAISGLHLTILLGVFRRVLTGLRLPRFLTTGATFAALFFYCVLTAWSPSVVRAAVMLGVLVAGEVTLWRVDRLTSLFFALLLLLLANPYALFSAGLQLSFLACLGLLLSRPHIAAIRYRIRRKHYRSRRYALLASLVSGLLTSTAAILFTFPVTVFSFGTVAYLAPVVNLLILPLFAPLLVLLLLSVVSLAVFPPAARVLAFLPGHALQFLERALVFLDKLGVGSANVGPVWMLLPALLAVCAVFAALFSKKRAFRLFAGFFAAFVVSLAISLVVAMIV